MKPRADWLAGDRVSTYCRLLGLVLLVFLVGAFVHILRPAFSDARHRPIAEDFDAFWSGGHLAWLGNPAGAYDGKTITTVENTGAQLAEKSILPFLYPPTFLLLCLPLGALPYLVAMPLFLAAGYAANVACLRRILPARAALVPILVLPAAVMNMVIGQNGFLTSLCFGGAMLLLDRRPALAGLCLGCLAYKPHLAICIPLGLAAARRFRAFFACGLGAAALMAASWLAFGSAPWKAFLGASGVIRAVMDNPLLWPKLISTYTAIRLLHGPQVLAYAGQAVVALACLLCVGAVCARRPGGRPEMAVLTVAALLCTPYAMDYDLVCLGVPMAWLAGEVEGGLEKGVLVACYLLPLVVRGVNLSVGIPLGPLLQAALLALVAARAGGWHRARQESVLF